MEPKAFQKIIWTYYKKHGRDLPWRRDTSPYSIFISEVMLQQTQVSRVITKYQEFTATFPDFQTLAAASPGEVLKAWQGLGYNRRGLFLHKAAKIIIEQHKGLLPKTESELVALPGIGVATASSIAAFAYNLPTVFIETNIRRIFIHHFFPRSKSVSDKKIQPLVKKTLPKNKAREWYWALMDYGSTLPKTITNPNRRSAHYAKQSKFEGSNRQIRGKILKALITHSSITFSGLKKQIKTEDDLLQNILTGMVREGLIQKKKQCYLLP